MAVVHADTGNRNILVRRPWHWWASVLANIMRFDFKTGFHYLAETFKLLAVTKYSGEELWNAVEKKMTINRSRKWIVGKGNFQHISIGEEE